VKAIVRAIDVGYRYTKWVAGVEDGHVHCKCFPSVAPLETGRDLAEALGRKRKTVVIEVDGLRYEVGPDALLAQETSCPSRKPRARGWMKRSANPVMRPTVHSDDATRQPPGTRGPYLWHGRSAGLAPLAKL
jgi:Actin like proteins N terminal domain